LKQVAKISHEKGYDHIYLKSKTATSEYYKKLGFKFVTNQTMELSGDDLIKFIEGGKENE
jgi:N-acetylglutamate synthase-like GNAT family acetyltransferase